jgi:hypothetical protein
MIANTILAAIIVVIYMMLRDIFCRLIVLISFPLNTTADK